MMDGLATKFIDMKGFEPLEGEPVSNLEMGMIYDSSLKVATMKCSTVSPPSHMRALSCARQKHPQPEQLTQRHGARAGRQRKA
jgi:hypothetical protein